MRKPTPAERAILGTDPDIECSCCERLGAYRWGSCPFCGARYPGRAPLLTSLNIAAVADATLPRLAKEFPRAEEQVDDMLSRLVNKPRVPEQE